VGTPSRGSESELQTLQSKRSLLQQYASTGVDTVKFLPLVWSALWRHRAESLLTLFALTVAFTLFGAMLALNAAYEKAIAEARMDRLFVTRRFDGPTFLPLGYREQLARIPGVTAVGGQIWFGGHEQDVHHGILIMFVDEGMRAAWPELPLSQADWRVLIGAIMALGAMFGVVKIMYAAGHGIWSSTDRRLSVGGGSVAGRGRRTPRNGARLARVRRP
jgi:hypothetical protein